MHLGSRVWEIWKICGKACGFHVWHTLEQAPGRHTHWPGHQRETGAQGAKAVGGWSGVQTLWLANWPGRRVPRAMGGGAGRNQQESLTGQPQAPAAANRGTTAIPGIAGMESSYGIKSKKQKSPDSGPLAGAWGGSWHPSGEGQLKPQPVVSPSGIWPPCLSVLLCKVQVMRRVCME